MFKVSTNWIAIPELLYFSLILICGILAVIAIYKIINGIVKKNTKKYFAIWTVVLLIATAYFVAIWGVHVIVANTMIGGSENATEMDKIRNSVAAKMETSDGKIVYADSENAVLKSFAGLQIHEAPMEPADNEDDWIYRITFNPAEKVSRAEEIVVSFHDTYVQINSEIYLPDDGVEYSSIMEWVQSKAVYMFE